MRDWGGGGEGEMGDQVGQGADKECFQGEEGQSLGHSPLTPQRGRGDSRRLSHGSGGGGESCGQQCNVWPGLGSREEVAGQVWGLGVGWPPQQH